MFETLIFALILTVTHLFAGHLRFLQGIPRSRWLSIAGGVSVAYVFLRLLPELGAGQEEVRQQLPSPLRFLEHPLYLFSLAGLVVFYGLERLVRASKSRTEKDGKNFIRRPGTGVFWLHMASFAVYNLLIGYLLVCQQEAGLMDQFWFTLAMALHFVVTDYGLRETHQHAYHQAGRWILSVVILLGWGLGVVLEVPPLLLLIMTGFLSGGIILNGMKEELPEERESRFLPFVLGAAVYSVVLLLL